jgi:AraC family transcriptional regulator
VRGRILSETVCGTVLVTELAYAAATPLHEHRHDGAYVSVLLDGAYTELHADLPRACTPGTVIVHDAGEVHADYFVAHGRCVNISGAGGRTLERDAVLCALRTTFPALRHAVARALAERGPQATGTEPDWLHGVLREFGWVEPVPLAGAARMAAMHPAHFARAFRRHAGMTPSAYRRRERVRAVSGLLLGSARSLTDIAHDCGFTDQSHLTNVFRETAGITPKCYRAAFAR